MKRPLLLIPLLALAAVQCLAQDPATNGLVGARAHLEACGFWDAAAYAAAEAHGPAAAAAAPRPAVLSAEEQAALWLDLARFALDDLAAAAEPPSADAPRAGTGRTPEAWFGLLFARLPEASQWPSLAKALGSETDAPRPEAAARLLAALRVLTSGLAGDRPAALAALSGGFPPNLPPQDPERRKEWLLWVRTDWTSAFGFLARDLSDGPPDLSAHLAALREQMAYDRRRDPCFGPKAEITDLLLSLPEADLDALLDEWIGEDTLDPAPLTFVTAQRLDRAPGVLARLRARLLARVRDGVPPELEGAVNRFAAHDFRTGSPDASPEGLELLRASVPFRIEAAVAAGTNAPNAEIETRSHPHSNLETDLRFLLRLAEGRGDADEAALCRRRLADAGLPEERPRPDFAEEPPELARARKTGSFAEATAALVAAWNASAPEDRKPDADFAREFGDLLYSWFDAAAEVDGREPANRAAIESAFPVVREWLEGRDLGPGSFLSDRHMLLPFVDLLERYGHWTEAETRLWDSIGDGTEPGAAYVWDDEEDLLPILELYLRAGRPRDVVDFVEGYSRWARYDLADGVDTLANREVACLLVTALRALGRDDEAARVAGWHDLSETAEDRWRRPFDPARDPWEKEPAARISWLLSAGFDGEARRVADAAGLAFPPEDAASKTNRFEQPFWRFQPLDEWRETLRAEIAEAAARRPPPVPPVFPAARIPVGGGGDALGGIPEHCVRWTDWHRLPAGLPERFAPLFSRRVPDALRYPPVRGWKTALDCLLRFSEPPKSPATPSPAEEKHAESAENAEPELHAESAKGAE